MNRTMGAIFQHSEHEKPFAGARMREKTLEDASYLIQVWCWQASSHLMLQLLRYPSQGATFEGSSTSELLTHILRKWQRGDTADLLSLTDLWSLRPCHRGSKNRGSLFLLTSLPLIVTWEAAPPSFSFFVHLPQTLLLRRLIWKGTCRIFLLKKKILSEKQNICPLRQKCRWQQNSIEKLFSFLHKGFFGFYECVPTQKYECEACHWLHGAQNQTPL